MAKHGRPAGGDYLPPERAKAQKTREQELLALVGLAPDTEREKLTREIAALVRIIRSNLDALRSGTLSEPDRLLLDQQIRVRTLKVNTLKQQLEAFSP